jgi:exopolyphosphatase/guanosine-5'-triphosphate,3'-diphosphate pyrophosphatase
MLLNDPPRPAHPGADTVYGALDLGTNNCRLLMAVPQGAGFQVVDAFSRMTRLGEGLAASGRLSPLAIERTIAALRLCAQKLRRRNTRRVRAVATEACRRAANYRDFLDLVRYETGLDLEIITAREEACLAMAGCAPLLARSPHTALIFDIGGGSTELIKVILSDDGTPTIETIESLPLGVVTLGEEAGGDLDCRDGYERIVAEAMERLRCFDRDGSLGELAKAGQLQMLGTSGTVTTLGGIHLDLDRYDRSLVDGLTMDFHDIEKISVTLRGNTFDERARHACIGPERADLVVAGCAILAAICRLWPTGSLRVADRGVREGILLSMMRSDARQAPS